MDKLRTLGYAQYTSTSTAFGLTGAPQSGNSLSGVSASDGGNQEANSALLQAETQNMRWTDDGTAPTATRGFLLYAGADPFLYIGDLTRLQFIQAASGAILNVGYYY